MSSPCALAACIEGVAWLTGGKPRRAAAPAARDGVMGDAAGTGPVRDQPVSAWRTRRAESAIATGASTNSHAMRPGSAHAGRTARR
jgi:hypothetical protein